MIHQIIISHSKYNKYVCNVCQSKINFYHDKTSVMVQIYTHGSTGALLFLFLLRFWYLNCQSLWSFLLGFLLFTDSPVSLRIHPESVSLFPTAPPSVFPKQQQNIKLITLTCSSFDSSLSPYLNCFHSVLLENLCCLASYEAELVVY